MGSIAVPGAELTEFEPQGLGPFHGRFRRLLGLIAGKKQSEIRAALGREIAVVNNGPSSQQSQAYVVSLLVLRDYLSSGYYPIISGNRCLLAPVFESSALSAAQRRVALQRMYESARARALVDRGQQPWIGQTAAVLRERGYDPRALIDDLAEGPPEVSIAPVTSSARIGDDRGLWRGVRATWSMGPEMSAPGREVAILVSDRRHPGVPLGIAQFRNVVPEIQARDRWLGISSGSDPGSGFLGLIDGDADLRTARIQATRRQLRLLLDHVNYEGLECIHTDEVDLARFSALMRGAQQRYQQERRDDIAGAHRHLAIVKRVETVTDLTRGVRILDDMLTMEDPVATVRLQARLRRELDAGLRKLWHYHMGFTAIEMSICGAAPPFGPLRVGKLIAGLAGSREVIDAWGTDRPLGSIASTVYHSEVRDAMPNPGPLVLVTSGLYPGHSAQYNRVKSGETRWTKIGDTTGFGSFHISVDTSRAIEDFNAQVDGYARITKTFGEGSGAKFRSVGRALGRLGLPDLRKHETRRPLYVLALVHSPQAVLLGWEDARHTTRPTSDEVASHWWQRWVRRRHTELTERASAAPDLPTLLEHTAKDLDDRTPR